MDLQRLREIFDTKATFAIVIGQDYTIDEMGASLAIFLALTSFGKNISIVSSKQPLVEVSNLVGIDKVKSSYESKSGDLVVSFPYQGDEIGKVSYTLEGGFLNIIVKPKENSLSFGERDVVFRRTGDIPEVLITVGVKRLSELGGFFNIESLKNTTIVNIDKNGSNEGFGDIVIIGQSASSVSEQVANILITLAYPMDPDIAQNLMDGIVTSTADFQNSRTGAMAFEMAGILLRNGAIRESITEEIQAPTQRFTPQSFGYPTTSVRPPQAVRPNLSQAVQAPSTQAVRPSLPQAIRSTSPQAIREFPREQKKDDQALGSKAPADWL